MNKKVWIAIFKKMNRDYLKTSDIQFLMSYVELVASELISILILLGLSVAIGKAELGICFIALFSTAQLLFPSIHFYKRWICEIVSDSLFFVAVFIASEIEKLDLNVLGSLYYFLTVLLLLLLVYQKKKLLKIAVLLSLQLMIVFFFGNEYIGVSLLTMIEVFILQILGDKRVQDKYASLYRIAPTYVSCYRLYVPKSLIKDDKN